jgi:hypothetical protein
MKQKKIKPQDELDYIPMDVDDYIDPKDIQKEFLKFDEIITDEQALKLKTFLEQLMEFSFIHFQQYQKRKQSAKILEFKQNEKESNFIHTSEYRRAS